MPPEELHPEGCGAICVCAVVDKVICERPHRWTGAGVSRFRARSPFEGQHRSRCFTERKALQFVHHVEPATANGT